MKQTELEHKAALRGLKIGKVKITKEMFNNKEEAVKAFQKKYSLKTTGTVDKDTAYKLKSIAASQGLGVKQIKKPTVAMLKACSVKRLSLNMITDKTPFSAVSVLQKNLAYLGYKIYLSEHIIEEKKNKSVFGKSTLKAVKAFQKDENLPQTGIFDTPTRKVLNRKILKDKPKAKIYHPYKIRGSVRDIKWRGKAGMFIEVSELAPFDKERTITPIRKTNRDNGFFDINYNPPIDKITGMAKKSFNIIVSLYDSESSIEPLATQTHHIISSVHWVNFVQSGIEPVVYNGNYKGLSEYQKIIKKLKEVDGFSLKRYEKKNITADFKEELLALSKLSSIHINHIMAIVYSELIREYFAEEEYFDSILKSELFYAFLVLDNYADFSDKPLKKLKNIPESIENIAINIALLDESIKRELISDAIKQNIVSQDVKINTKQILKVFSIYQIKYTLSKNILEGEMNLNLLLKSSSIMKDEYSKIALAYISTNDFSEIFWEKTKDVKNIESFRKVVDITELVDSDKELQALLKIIDVTKESSKVSDIVKLGKNKIDEKIILKAEKKYPAVSLIAHIKNSTKIKNIINIQEIEKFIDDNKIDLDKDIIDKNLAIAPNLKIIQRVHKITPNPKLAVKLLENTIHNAHQIYTMGKVRLSQVLNASPEEIDKIYANAKLRHMQVTNKILEYKEIANNSSFAVMARPNLKNEENKENEEEISLKNLFGSMDYCECEHCESLYGPTAYLTDILNFLNQQPTTKKDKIGNDVTVMDITLKDKLFERRVDIGKIELSCENTLTPIPYIDLVCEVLENYILKMHKDDDKDGEDEKEWLYTKIIGNPEYSIGNSFDLNSEFIHSYLDYMNVPRYKLMETFNVEENTIAMSFFGIRKDKNKITSMNSSSTIYTENDVVGFMEKRRVSYNELLLLTKVDYLGRLEIENNGCSLENQVLKNVQIVKIDSFIQLWRHTSWEIKELDLLIMHDYIGKKNINDETLINLKYIKQIQDMLGLSIEDILYFFSDDINLIKPYMEDFFFFLENLKYPSSIEFKFTNPKELFFSLQEFNEIQSSSLSLLELEYCLNGNMESVVGLRQDTITKMINELSEILKNSNDTDLSIKMHIAQSFDLEQQQASVLMDNNPDLLTRLKEIELIEQIELTKEIEEDYILLHKSALLISKMSIEAKVLEWFNKNFDAVETFDFNEKVNSFQNWYNLYTFLTFKNSFPEPENASLIEILTLAIDDDRFYDAKELLVDLTQSKVATILDGNYKNASFYKRILQGIAQEKKLGSSINKMQVWATISDKTVVKEIGELIDKKDRDLIDNAIREKKRTALVDYLILYSQSNNTLPTWTDNNSLYKYFLIDVEMSACQETSRVKQALSSIQLFVQRCFLNLEENIKITSEQKENKSLENSWSQWKWMKNYRVWEANRKIFFYPENWLEPELRDDKTEIFKTFENALLQNEISDEYVEEAFKSYLHEMDELSDLEITAFYHQYEVNTNLIHVIARTRAIPNIYYYCTYDINYSNWNSWEKIDADIDGDTLVPVIYNRKLHLFYLQFMEKPIKSKKIPAAQPSEGPTDNPEALTVLEIQLAWIVKDFRGWSSKKISKQKLIHPWSRPKFSYLLKPSYKVEENELFVNIYLSTSKEFNNTKFYDPMKSRAENPIFKTQTRFNEVFNPWHSSSFVFDGNVKEVRIKGLGNPTWNPNIKDSYEKICDEFQEDGQSMIRFANEHEDSLKLPRGMHYHYNYLTNNTSHKNINELKILSNKYNLTLLKDTPEIFKLIVSQQDLQPNIKNKLRPFFYQDSKKAFFIEHKKEYRVSSFYNPYTSLFIRELNKNGVKGLFNRDLQISPEKYGYASKNNDVSDVVDFSFNGVNSIYNWELFFHAPFMIANKLMQNQKFEEAMKWFHYIFNPTNIDDADSPQRFWITKPFYDTSSSDYQNQRINTLLSNINENNPQLNAWKNDPFNPYIIARYRTVAFQKNVVMKYIDNLISWGDMLFRRDSVESINEASLLYILAYEILGKRPTKIKKKDIDKKVYTYNELEKQLNDFSNAIEDTISSEDNVIDIVDAESLPINKNDYFCTPHNENISDYWDKVEDRLFKIRHCMNIKGIVRELPLFQPPIDPALLVKANASGLDITQILNDVSNTTPMYRFRVVLQKALEFTNDVKQYGDKLLSIVEKKDAEALSILRSEHETELLELTTDIRKKQLEEAKEQIIVLQKNRASTEERYNYYSNIEKISIKEQLNLNKLKKSHKYQLEAQNMRKVANNLALIPEFHFGANGFGGSPHVVMQLGGSAMSKAQNIVADIFSTRSSVSSYEANRASILGGHDRRYDDWKLQEKLAKKELESIDIQILISEIRQNIAETELKNHEKQIENSKSINSYMKDKFTNKELYTWMLNQVSTLYFQSYELAYSMAKKAEESYKYELGIASSNIIQGGYWDSLHKGLLSGDKLMSDLRKLDVSYMEKNTRGFEITKHVSLAQIFPEELIKLKTNGNCLIELPEWLFDMDYPSHYMRRIKSVSLSIPCIVGPYTSINCTLTLNKGYIRRLNEDLTESQVNSENSAIVTSSGQNDSGMFELNFHDDQYLPFEGVGIVESEWKIDMPKDNNNFDFNSLSDVIMHINYTALDDKDNKRDISTDLKVLLSLKDNFPTQWHRLKNDTSFDSDFEIKPEHLPFRLRPYLTSLSIEKVYKEQNENIEEISNDYIKEFLNNTISINENINPDEIENIYIIVAK